MTSTPEGWQSAPLGEVCRIVSGSTPRTGVAEYWGGDIKWITPNDLSKDRSQFIQRGERNLTAAGYESCSARLFPAGSVIVSSRAPIGYVAIAGSEMCTNQGCKTAVPPHFIDSRYLYWFLLNAKPDLEARASGTTFKEISAKRFAETRFWWPGLDEQRRVVEILEDLFSRVDAAVGDVSSAAARLGALRGRVLDCALGEAEATGSPVSLGSLVRPGRKLAYGVLVPGPHVEEGVPLVRVGDLRGGVVRQSELKRIAPEVSGKFPRTLLEGGEVLMSLVGTIGRTGVAPRELANANVARAVGVLPLRDGVDAHYVSLLLEAPRSNRELNGLAHEVARKTLNLEDVKRFELPMLSPQEQRRILASADEALSAVRRMEAATTAASSRSTSLRRSILAAAFSGRLA